MCKLDLQKLRMSCLFCLFNYHAVLDFTEIGEAVVSMLQHCLYKYHCIVMCIFMHFVLRMCSSVLHLITSGRNFTSTWLASTLSVLLEPVFAIGFLHVKPLVKICVDENL
ncbi:hypothetical protein MRX96_025457 [Rhipicephalus microplus]